MSKEVSLVDKFLAKWTAGRVVTLLSPLIFVPLAGYISLQAGQLGIDLPADQTVAALSQLALFGVGALVASIKSSQWLKGWREYEARMDDILKPAQEVNVSVESPVEPLTDVDEDDELDEAIYNGS